MVLLHRELQLQGCFKSFFFCDKSRVKRRFCKSGLSLFANVSWKMLALEVWIVTFCDSLVEHALFGSLDYHFL